MARAQAGAEHQHRESLLTSDALLGGSPAAEPVLLHAEDRTLKEEVPSGPARSGAATEAPVAGHEPPERGPWELLKFTLPTLGVWVVNPCVPLFFPHRACRVPHCFSACAHKSVLPAAASA